jgi:hypothetical protein
MFGFEVKGGSDTLVDLNLMGRRGQPRTSPQDYPDQRRDP